MASTEILDIPFFSLEYDAKGACFLRKLPPEAVDLYAGRFQWNDKVYRLAAGEDAEKKILEQPVIKGKDILALVRRGYNPLVKSGPLMAERGDRLMELGLSGGTVMLQEKPKKDRSKEKNTKEKHFEIEIVLRMNASKPEEWLPLDGLPYHKLYENRIYEIIPDEVLALFTGDSLSLTLRGEEIPAFADNYARLIYVFADELLYKLLAQDAVFIDPADVSLVLHCQSLMERGVGKAQVFPALKYERKRFSANALSRYYHRNYLPVKGRWLRREILERMGIGPLGCFINGESLKPFEIKAKDFLAGGGEALKNIFLAEKSGHLETDRYYWLKYGKEEEIFSGHLEFLRHWGFSGGIIAEPQKAAPFLAAWLVNLAKDLLINIKPTIDLSLFGIHEEGRVLVLMPKSFWNQRLIRDLPQTGEGPLRVPADRWAGADSVWEPAFCGIGLAFFEDPIFKHAVDLESKARRFRWDILVVAGLDEVPNPELVIQQLENIPARLRLGLFFSASALFGNEKAAEIKAFFNIKGAALKYEKYLIRETGDLLTLPSPPPPEQMQKPPWPVDENYLIIGAARFSINAKFKNIPAFQYMTEQKEIHNTRTSSPFVPIETIYYRYLSEDEKIHFRYWRTEFRKGRAWECSPAHVLIYAKQLILLMDNSANENFKELCRLWKTYREIFPQTLEAFPRWLFDFVIIHHQKLWGVALTATLDDIISVLSGASVSANTWGVLLDLHLHNKYIEENHSLEWKDFAPITKNAGKESNDSNLRQLFYNAGDEALNNLDRALRKYYGKKLLEFFYPLPPIKENFVAFDDQVKGQKTSGSFPDLGHSEYSAEWLAYSRHKPLIKFLDSLAVFLEYRVIKSVDPENRNSPPLFDPVWKYLCGFDETPPPELEDLVLPKTGSPIDDFRLRLEEDKINRLREESDEVMEMLKIIDEDYKFEDRGHFKAAAQPAIPDNMHPAIMGKSQSAMAQFVAGLDAVSRVCLELISQGKGRDFEAFARENNTMAELIIDRINEQFLSEFGDLLIENESGQPQIGDEYKDEVLWALTFQNA